MVLRTAPGLGNVTVDWTVRGPMVERTFTHSSGKLVFTEVRRLWDGVMCVKSRVEAFYSQNPCDGLSSTGRAE